MDEVVAAVANMIGRRLRRRAVVGLVLGLPFLVYVELPLAQSMAEAKAQQVSRSFERATRAWMRSWLESWPDADSHARPGRDDAEPRRGTRHTHGRERRPEPAVQGPDAGQLAGA